MRFRTVGVAAFTAAITGACAALCGTATADMWDDYLARWLETQLYFVGDKEGRTKLFFRREPVRVLLHTANPVIDKDVKHSIEAFSIAAGLSVQFTSRDPNLIAYVDSPISEGDRPSQTFLRKVGLPDGAINAMKNSTGWASGCGIYTFQNERAGPLLSLAFADRRLSDTQIVDCMTEGVIRAFGFRHSARSTVRAEDAHLQYIFLVSHLRVCDQKLQVQNGGQDQSDVRSQYLECLLDRIRKGVKPD